jgi:hypothetical protein
MYNFFNSWFVVSIFMMFLTVIGDVVVSIGVLLACESFRCEYPLLKFS